MQTGLEDRYEVKRRDGSSDPGGKHENCRYFVLDIYHDRHALTALQAYIQSAQFEYTELCKDLVGLYKLGVEAQKSVGMKAPNKAVAFVSAQRVPDPTIGDNLYGKD